MLSQHGQIRFTAAQVAVQLTDFIGLCFCFEDKGLIHEYARSRFALSLSLSPLLSSSLVLSLSRFLSFNVVLNRHAGLRFTAEQAPLNNIFSMPFVIKPEVDGRFTPFLVQFHVPHIMGMNYQL